MAIKVFTPTGQEFVTSLQFQVHKLWPIRFGMLLERRLGKEYPSTPAPPKKKTNDLRRQSMEQSLLQKGSFAAPYFHQSDNMPSHSGSCPTEELPFLFSLSHPLDEICPITFKNGK